MLFFNTLQIPFQLTFQFKGIINLVARQAVYNAACRDLRLYSKFNRDILVRHIAPTMHNQQYIQALNTTRYILNRAYTLKTWAKHNYLPLNTIYGMGKCIPAGYVVSTEPEVDYSACKSRFCGFCHYRTITKLLKRFHKISNNLSRLTCINQVFVDNNVEEVNRQIKENNNYLCRHLRGKTPGIVYRSVYHSGNSWVGKLNIIASNIKPNLVGYNIFTSDTVASSVNLLVNALEFNVNPDMYTLQNVKNMRRFSFLGG